MAGPRAKIRWALALRYTFAALLCLLIPVAIRAGLQWYWAVIMLCLALLIVVSPRRIFRPGIGRATNEVVCRYLPWYEGSAYFLCLALPLMGVAAVAAGQDPDNPAWLRLVGFILLAVMPLILWSAVQLWRRSLLRISPAALTLHLPTPGSKLTEIRREQVESITPKMVRNPVNGQSLQTEIAYRVADSNNSDLQTVLLGLHLTVQPTNLANALVAWKDATDEDPNELLDRIEGILRGMPA
ncbi:hypothetical protein PP713_19155 [Mycobacterium sp. CSUR Q5927]|nr:hypothetical protein [Mycobacterium sp. CSUR Q5927]